MKGQRFAHRFPMRLRCLCRQILPVFNDSQSIAHFTYFRELRSPNLNHTGIFPHNKNAEEL